MTVIDNLSGGRKKFIEPHLGSSQFKFHEADVRDSDAMKLLLHPKIDRVYQLAANEDISRGVEDPTLDFEHSIKATFSILQAIRTHGIKKLFYTSGSGVYGERAVKFVAETEGPLEPVSMYGASKLSAEALVCCFAHLYDFQAFIVRPANIIGPRVTHGVVFDFVRRLKKDPSQLTILGDGKQSKAYLHVDDVIDAFLLIQKKAKGQVSFFNLSSNTFINVNGIADEVLKGMALKKPKRTHTGGRGGWKGDVPIVRLYNTRLNKLGWKPRYTSRQAVQATVKSLLTDSAFVLEGK